MIAEASHWKHLPFGQTTTIPYEATFGMAQFEKIRRGLVPKAMEDKWFIFFDEPNLCFYRSWTGEAVYWVTLRPFGNAYRVSEAVCVSEMLAGRDRSYKAELLDFLIHNLLLEEARPFPRPRGLEEPAPGVYQHAISGTGYSERIVAARPWWKFWG